MPAVSGRPVTLGLLGLAALIVGGCIAQVVLEEVYGRPVSVDPTLQTLATTAIFAVFGQGFFSQHQETAAQMRAGFVQALNIASGNSPTESYTPSSESLKPAAPPTSPSSPTTSSPSTPAPTTGAPPGGAS